MSAANPSSPHVLIVSHNFPPILGPDSILMKMWALGLHRRGWRVTVLTTTEHHWNLKADFGLLAGLPADMEIIRAYSPEAFFGAHPRLRSAAYWLLGRLGVADIHLAWQYTALKKILPWMAKNKPDIIYSRQPKHVSAVVAMKLKQQFQIPWIAHFSDLWAALPYRELRSARQWKAIETLEAEEMNQVDGLLFVSQRAANLTLAKYNASIAAKSTLIRHGYETLPPEVINTQSTASGPLRMVHAGAFYPGISGPQGLFEAISILNNERSLVGRFKLECFGPDTVVHQDTVNQLRINDLVSLESILPFAEAQRRIGEADVLLVIPYDGTSLPTKLFEYFAFSKPILGLALADTDTADVMRDCDLPVVAPNDVDGIVAQLRQMLTMWEERKWGLSKKSEAAISHYHIDRQVETVSQKMEELIRSH